jgi:hypothetical protein
MTVHHPFSRRLMRDHAPRIRRYSVDRADWQYSLSGKFDEEPTAWRFVILDVDDDVPDAVGYLPAWVQPLIWTDHVKVIERMAAWEVAPTIVVDRRCGQVTSAKFLFLYDAGGSEEQRAARRDHYLNVHVPAVGKILGAAFGARLYVSNLVVREAETSDQFGPGSSYTGRYLPTSSLLAVDEFWFDNVEWGTDVFQAPDAIALFRDSILGRVEGYSVDQVLGVDKTGP